MVKKIFLKDVPLSFSDSGQGECLVLLHGHLESREIWDGFTKGLESGYRVICIDLPGHGGSGTFGPVTGMEVMAEAVQAVLEMEEIKKAVIIGHSMGGYTALAALEHYPEIFKAIILFHSHPRADSPEVVKKREREIRIIRKGQKRLLVNQNIPSMYADDNQGKFRDAISFSKELAHGLDDEGVIAAIEGMKVRPDRSSVLKNADIPCLNIIGKKDNYIDFNEVSLKTELPRGSVRYILEESGHMGFVEEPEKALNGITHFLKSIG